MTVSPACVATSALEHAAEIVADAEDRVEDEEARQAQGERDEQQQRDLDAGVEQLQRPLAADAAEGAHDRAVEQAEQRDRQQQARQ